MEKRAVIYIRVSSEKQGDKASPQAQENDCREYSQNKGYQVVKVYKDIQRYKVGKRMVEPSGTRADRPGLKALLADAYAGKFDIVVAWREDRLYRSYRPMLDVLDCIDETGIDIELVKETFDKRLAPVKAWAARMELDAKHDRYMMGVAARLASGKSWNHPAPYGYTKDKDGYYEVNEDEAQWVLKLFEWYAECVSIREIRHRFITGGAKQRNLNLKYTWNMVLLRRMLTEEYYWTGIHKMNWNGKVYKIPSTPIVPMDLAQRVIDRKAKYKCYPAGNARHKHLVAGLVYCAACGTRANIVTKSYGSARRDGTRKKWIIYQCSNKPNVPNDNCFSRAGAKKIDKMVWDKVWNLISEPGAFERSINTRIEQLQAEEVDAQADCEILERQLDEISLERQKVITWARKAMITEEDLETQLLSLSWQEDGLMRELADKRILVGNRADRLIELADLFRKQFITGWEGINSKPDSEELREEQLKFRQKIVRAAVKRIDINTDKSVRVHVELDLDEEVHIMNPATTC